MTGLLRCGLIDVPCGLLCEVLGVVLRELLHPGIFLPDGVAGTASRIGESDV